MYHFIFANQLWNDIRNISLSKLLPEIIFFIIDTAVIIDVLPEPF